MVVCNELRYETAIDLPVWFVQRVEEVMGGLQLRARSAATRRCLDKNVLYIITTECKRQFMIHGKQCRSKIRALQVVEEVEEEEGDHNRYFPNASLLVANSTPGTNDA